MAWERRERGGSYYTRSKKVNGLVVREYVGCGLFAEIAACADSLRRLERKEAATRRRARSAHLDDIDARVEEFCNGVEDITSATLLLAGYRKHKRGEWRREREPRKTD